MDPVTSDDLKLVLEKISIGTSSSHINKSSTDLEPMTENNFRFFVLSTEQSPKHSIMLDRFQQVGIKSEIIEEIKFTDPRISKHNDSHGRCLSIMYGHLEMIKSFLESGLEYGIMCENDLFLRKDILKQIPIVIRDYEKHGLDIMLLSYLMTRHPLQITALGGVQIFDETSNLPFRYCRYGDELWGAQMYLISRAHAYRLITKFNEEYFDRKISGNYPSLRENSSDWTITKYGDRALISPMLAVEDSRPDYFNDGQNDIHHETTRNNFDSNLFY